MLKLRWYQEEAIEAVYDFFSRKKGHPLIAVPTGAGKSLIIAEFVRRTLQRWPTQRILCLTHQQELVSQNAAELHALWPELSIGIYSAGLKKKKIRQVTFASIQSAYRKPELFHQFNIILVDEAHLIPNKNSSMYRTLLDVLDVPVIGLTATPFRMDSGFLVGNNEDTDALFTDLIYDCSSGNKFLKLIDQGYLCNLVTKQPQTAIDVSNVSIRAGEFIPNELSDVADQESITEAALDEVVKHGNDRKHWLFFAVDIAHAEHIGEALTRRGISNTVVHSRMERDRKEELDKFLSGEVRAAVNVNVLSVGFNHKGIDLIALLRPTASPVLHAQMLGRGMRILPGKDNCLVLDFAGNTARLGPLNALRIGPKKKGDGTGEPITKTCPECDSIVHAASRVCPDCGYEFPIKTKLREQADQIEVIERQQGLWLDVMNMTFHRHKKKGKPDSVKVTYRCGLTMANEWLCFDHSGFAKRKAEAWWRQHSKTGLLPPETVEEALDRTNELLMPKRLFVMTVPGTNYLEVNSYEFDDRECA